MLVVVVLLLRSKHQNRVSTDHTDGEVRVVTVHRVLDGDTIDCTDGTRVRLLGIDAPEVAHGDKPGEPGGVESADWLRKRIEGTTVTLAIGDEPVDRYGRTLAWIYDVDNRLINEELLAVGHAKLVTAFGLPAELEPALRRASAEARVHKRGMWQR